MTSLARSVLHVRGMPERILEIECGDGEGALFLAREYPGARVRGVDRSEEAVRTAVARIGLDPEGRIAFKRGSADSLPYPEDQFDLVVQRRGRVNPGEVARVLRPRGHLVLVGPMRVLLGWSLRRRGIVPVQSGEVDGVRFAVGRFDI